MRPFLISLALLLSPLAAFPQAVRTNTTTVTINVTDFPDGQVWANGSYATFLVLNAGSSNATSSPGPAGALDPSGNATFVLTSENDITFPTGGSWQVTVCPAMGCSIGTSAPVTLSFVAPITSVVGSTISENIIPPSFRIPIYTLRPLNAYRDSEVQSSVLGSEYFNVTSSALRYCALLPCATNWTPIGTGGGGGSSTVFNVTAYGAVCDGVHLAQDNLGIRAAITAALPVKGTVFFPHGTCQLDISGGSYNLNNVAGLTLAGEGPASQIVLNSATNIGFSFIIASGLTIRDLAFSAPTTITRSNGYPVSVDQCTNCLIANNSFTNGNTGLRIGNSNNVEVVGNTFTGFVGNGIFSLNNIQVKFVNTSCFLNGDTCEEYSFYDVGEAQNVCDQITSTGMTSRNDGHGFVVNSCSDVSLSNFSIVGAGTTGINIIQDHATTTTHFPTQVEVANGSIFGSGYGSGFENTVAAPGINIAMPDGNPAVSFQNITLTNLNISHTAQRGIVLTDNNTVNLTASNIRIDDAGNAQVTGNGEGIRLAGGNTVKMSNIYVRNANTWAFRTTGPFVDVNGLTVENACQANTSCPAIQNNASSGYWVLNDVTIIDTWAGANRSAIISSATSGIQSISHLTQSCTVACGLPTFSNSTATNATILPGLYTVSSGSGHPALPAASTATGAMAVVVDAASSTVGTCTGAGTTTMLAMSDGIAWTCH